MRTSRTGTDLRGVFLDRDGVINRKAPDGDYITSWEEFEFLPDALEALRVLAESTLAIIVVTNQRGIGLGRMTESDLAEIHRKMLDAVGRNGGRIDAVYYCPHESGCTCRKPEPGMFEAAARDLGVRLEQTAVVGDSQSDIDAAARIGASGVLIDGDDLVKADYVATDLLDAVTWLLS